MPTAPGCALIVTAPLSVQAELADRPNPPNRPLPADPVVRYPKVTVGGEKGTASPPTQGCGAGSLASGASSKMPPVPKGTYPSGIFNGDRFVCRLRCPLVPPLKLVFPSTSVWEVGNMIPPPKLASCLLSLSLRGPPSPHPQENHCLLTLRASALRLTCLALELESRPQWYPPGRGGGALRMGWWGEWSGGTSDLFSRPPAPQACAAAPSSVLALPLTSPEAPLPPTWT